MVDFDRFASGYSGGGDDPLKRLFGKNLDQFIHVKAKWLWNHLTQGENEISLNQGYHLLDYGCGTGEMLKWMKIFGFPGHLYGADVSQAMLDEAEKRWNLEQKPSFSLIGETTTDYADHSFHGVVATSVFHHIAPQRRDRVLQEINRILVPGGELIIFEHNPFNPVVRLIVKRATIDKDAILLYPNEIRDRYQKVPFVNCDIKYIMFFPPKIEFLQQYEKYLWWFPLGAEYAAVGKKQS